MTIVSHPIVPLLANELPTVSLHLTASLVLVNGGRGQLIDGCGQLMDEIFTSIFSIGSWSVSHVMEFVKELLIGELPDFYKVRGVV